MDTYKKCKEMKEAKDLWYPTYCDALINKHEGNGVDVQTYAASDSASSDTSATTPPIDPNTVLPDEIIGWGWSEWGEWGDGGCPEICGRRCNRRARYCTGPYRLICKGRGILI